jgi:16S rRNA (cytosine967-C5)-methyltransferase
VLAAEALLRIDRDAAYANLLLPKLLARSPLDPRDRARVTELVYGATRMRRACDWLVDRFLADPRLDPDVRAVLRLGAYELAFLDVPPHAAVSEAVEIAPRRARGLVNAVLRRVADAPRDWPSDGVRLSQPDWLVRRLSDDLGPEVALAALETMNRPPVVTERSDGYVQDLGSQLVVAAVDAGPGDLVVDLCAAPGGKATGIAAMGAVVVAADLRPGRVGLIERNRRRLGTDGVLPLVADGTAPAVRAGIADRVLVDAPCSGFGTLRRRPDARWNLDPEAPERLARLQLALCRAAVGLLRPGGVLVYSVCTLTRAEGPGVDEGLRAANPGLVPLPPPEPWEPWEGGGRLLPQSLDTDGMLLFRYLAPG